MPFNGSGVFNRLKNWVLEAAQGYDILPDHMDTDTNDIANGLSNCITKDGQQTIIADIPWNGYGITGLRTPFSSADAATKGYTDSSISSLTSFVAANYAPIMSPGLLGTPTAPTAAVGTNTNQIATMAALLAQAFSATLPNQPGNKNKFVSTDGANALWKSAGVQIASVAGGTLTNASTIQAFIANASYTLPDFTGSDTFGLAAFGNSPAVPTSVTTSDGWAIATGLSANSTKFVAPTSVATPHGTWGSLTMTPPILGTFAASSAPTLEGSVQLTAGLVVLLYSVSSRTGGYVVALNTNTNTFGTPVTLGTTSSGTMPWAIYADSTSTFVVGFNGAATVTAVAGSVSGVAITLGSPVNGTYPLDSNFLQLAAGTYLYNNGPQCEVFSVSGTGITKSANTNIGAALNTNVSLVKIDSTRALAVGFSTVASPAQLKSVVISVSAGTPSGGTVASAATTILAGGVYLRFLRALAATGPFICCAQDNSVGTTGDYYGMTVSGTTVTIGTVLQIASTLPSAAYQTNYLYQPASDASLYSVPYNGTTLLVGYGGGAIAITISGTTLTAGSVFGSAPTTFPNDASTGLIFYAATSASISKITVSGTTITASSTVAVSGAPAVISSDTLNDKVVNYGGTWYTWTLASISCAITSTKWLGISGSNFNLYGPIS